MTPRGLCCDEHGTPAADALPQPSPDGLRYLLPHESSLMTATPLPRLLSPCWSRTALAASPPGFRLSPFRSSPRVESLLEHFLLVRPPLLLIALESRSFMGIPPPWNDFHLLHVQVLIRQTGTPDVYSSVRQRLIPPILQFPFRVCSV